MKKNKTLIPVYSSKGDTEAYLQYPYLFNCQGDWIGFVTRDREVYSVYGQYVGWLSNDPRILRKRSYSYDKPKITPPPKPKKLVVPALGPLAPLMAELTYDVVDILQEWPDQLPTLDHGEHKKDLD
ncbi:MAG: hypothetical protein JW757_02995 [Anaerolineales bacterium]|nr:hypothetical protein [Anaerolineales bacterium]